MKLINTILILIIILFLIKYFTNGNLINTLNQIFNNCKQNIELFTGKQNNCIQSDIPFANQLDFPYLYKNNTDEETLGLYKFINNIISKNVNNYELTPSSGERIKISKSIENELVNILTKMFNYEGYNFHNIKLNQDIYYYENYRGKEFEPFIFTTDVIYNNKNLGNITLLIYCFLRYDKVNYQLSITNLKIIKQNKNNESSSVINDNDLFIKPPKQVSFENDTDNSLIPSIDNLSL